MKKYALGLVLLGLLLNVIRPVFSAIQASRAWVITVSPSTDGTPVIAAAMAAAKPGEIIKLKKGVYRERVVITKPLTIEGEKGAILDVSQPFKPSWQPATDLAPGVYKAVVTAQPVSLIIDGKYLAMMDERRKEAQDEKGDFYWKHIMSAGMKRTGFTLINGVCMYRAADKCIYVHLKNDEHPSKRTWTIIYTEDPGVLFKGAHNAHLRNLEIRYAYTGTFFGDKSDKCSVEHCIIGPWDMNGVDLDEGSTNTLIESNEIFRTPYENTGFEDTRESYETWQIHKEVGYYDRVGIWIYCAGAGNRVHGNHVHDTFDGIDVSDPTDYYLAQIPENPYDNMDLEIWGNRIENTRDSGMELGGPCINVSVHNNLLKKTLGGIRFKIPRFGPLFIYRNVLLDGTPMNFYFSMDDTPCEGYVYHNTCVGGDQAVYFPEWDDKRFIGCQNFHFINNVFVCPQKGFTAGDRSCGAIGDPIRYWADYNVVVGPSRAYAGDKYRDAHSKYVDSALLAPGLEPRPLPGSPAIGAGVDLSTYLHGYPLPGCPPGYFKGKAPNAGAFEEK
jgi:hypothetical protein